MYKLIQLAWRNIWRNKRRTLITSASVFFGVVLSSYMTSMQEGSYAQMIRTIVNSYSGYLQIHKKGYDDDKVINNAFEYSAGVKTGIADIRHITNLAPRLESYALASGEDLTKGVMVLGIQPEEEDRITRLSKKIISGAYLEPGDSGVVIGKALGRYMQLQVNDTLILLSQGFHGAMAAGKYCIRGILQQPSPELDRSAVYMDITQCQSLFSAPGRLTSLVVMVQRPQDVYLVKHELTSRLSSSFEVKDWKEMNRILLKQIDSDRSSGAIIKGILYLVIAFGIFGTIMMMTLERRKEFGVLVAVGMRKNKLSMMLVWETVFISLLGAIAGILISVPLVWYYVYHPIQFTGQAAESMLQMGFDPVMSFSIAPSVFLRQALTMLAFSLLIGLYPVISTSRLVLTKALRS